MEATTHWIFADKQPRVFGLFIAVFLQYVLKLRTSMGLHILFLLLFMGIALIILHESIGPCALALTLPTILFLRKRVSRPVLIVSVFVYFFITYYFLVFCFCNFLSMNMAELMSKNPYLPDDLKVLKDPDYMLQYPYLPDDWWSFEYYIFLLRFGIVLPVVLYLLFFSALILKERRSRTNSLHRCSRDVTPK